MARREIPRRQTEGAGQLGRLTMTAEIKKFGKITYVIRYPENFCKGEKYPILLFLHGAGTRGNDTALLLENPFFKLTDEMEPPFIIIAPQCSENTWFDMLESLIDLVKHIHSSDFADKKHFYAMGASMGGYAAWQIGMSCPELFSAIVPICGGGMYWNAPRLKNVPVWAFHGDIDPTVKVEESVKMVDAVKRCGGEAKLTVYENCGHDAWTATYTNPAVFEWMLSHESKNADLAPDKYKDSKIYG